MPCYTAVTVELKEEEHARNAMRNLGFVETAYSMRILKNRVLVTVYSPSPYTADSIQDNIRVAYSESVIRSLAERNRYSVFSSQKENGKIRLKMRST